MGVLSEDFDFIRERRLRYAAYCFDDLCRLLTLWTFFCFCDLLTLSYFLQTGTQLLSIPLFSPENSRVLEVLVKFRPKSIN